jgi:hypothetical protein
MLERGVAQERIDEIRASATSRVDEHLQRALAWPDPSADTRLEHVYA